MSGTNLDAWIETQTESLSGSELSPTNDAAGTFVDGGQPLVFEIDASGPTTDTMTDLQDLITDPTSGLFTNVCNGTGTTAGALCAVLNTQLRQALAPGGAVDAAISSEIAGQVPAGLVGAASLDATLTGIELSSDGSRHLSATLTFDDFDGAATFDVATLTGMGALSILGNANVTVDLEETCLVLTVDVDLSEVHYPYPWPQVCGIEITDASAWSSEAPGAATIGYTVTAADAELTVDASVDDVTVTGLTIFANGAVGNALETALRDADAALEGSPIDLIDAEVRPSFTLSGSDPRLFENRVTDVEVSGDVVTYQVDWDVDWDVDASWTVIPDGHQFGVDNCPWTPNPDQEDRDLDGVGDECEAESFTTLELMRIWMALVWKHCQNNGLTDVRDLSLPEFAPTFMTELYDPAQLIDWAALEWQLEPWVNLPPVYTVDDALARVHDRIVAVQPVTGVPPELVAVTPIVVGDQTWLAMDLSAAADRHPDQLALLVLTLPLMPLDLQH